MVFHYLSNVETYTRYEEQLSQIMMDKTSREVNLFQSILINDEFLLADDEEHPDMYVALADLCLTRVTHPFRSVNSPVARS